MFASPLLITILIMMMVLFIVMALRTMQRRGEISTVGATMARTTTTAAPDLRNMQLRQPFADRVLRPWLRRLYRLGRTFTPARTIAQIQETLIIAGLPGGMTVTDFLGLRFLVGASLGTVVFTLGITQSAAMQAFTFAFAAFIVGLYLPNFWLRSKAQARQKSISRALPDVLDMMSICVDAGLGFEAALQRVAFEAEHELALELRRVISEIRVGVSRSDALRHLVERTQVPEVASFVAVLVQADRLGIAIRNVLTTQSVQMRVHRRQRAEEEAGKAPIKMMIPMVLFIFPSLFIVILGPAIPRLMAAF